jgi:hypothetical protein
MSMFSRDSRLPLLLAAGVLILVCGATLQHASLVIDHQRYYYLDDDQMISMRYARNLVDGQGLVWNAGDHVEGYTNLGWVMVMAAVHAIGVPERLTSLVVKLINIGLAVLILALADALMRRLARPPAWLRAAVLVTLALSIDLVYWVVNGFETTLLTAAFLWALIRMLDDAERGEWSIWTCLLAGLLPIIRSDAADLTGVVLATGFLLGTRRRFWAIGLAALPLALHLAFRLHYYGEWLPNTYYLKVAGRSGLLWSGLGYLKGFVAAYPTVVVLAAGAALIPGDRRARVLLASLFIVALRVMTVGADMFPHYRFVAPLLPVLLALSAMVIAALADRRSAAVVAAVLLASTVLVSGINGPQTLWLACDYGMMRPNVVTGWLINHNTRPDATVLVNAAGSVGYFSHRTAYDMLGKVDREIGHLAPHDDEFTGHNHYDIEKSLAHSPDLVETLLSAPLVQHADEIFGARPPSGGIWDVALVTNQTFRTRYLPNPVPVPYLLKFNSVFVRDGSPEKDRIATWHVPELDEAEPH